MNFHLRGGRFARLSTINIAGAASAAGINRRPTFTITLVRGETTRHGSSRWNMVEARLFSNVWAKPLPTEGISNAWYRRNDSDRRDYRDRAEVYGRTLTLLH